VIEFEPERPKWKQVAEVLEQRIYSGTYRPRDKIPGVEGIVTEFGVSHNTARHVLRYLAEEGLVVLVPSLGTFVSRQIPGRS
jgi:DNA-binding GntR family transcriptional regulator